jgi:hypothetical protein
MRIKSPPQRSANGDASRGDSAAAAPGAPEEAVRAAIAAGVCARWLPLLSPLSQRARDKVTPRTHRRGVAMARAPLRGLIHQSLTTFTLGC